MENDTSDQLYANQIESCSSRSNSTKCVLCPSKKHFSLNGDGRGTVYSAVGS
jgi:hypothetical protein